VYPQRPSLLQHRYPLTDENKRHGHWFSENHEKSLFLVQNLKMNLNKINQAKMVNFSDLSFGFFNEK
jgi:hypothetical protein